jgi:hypothetical protein
MAKDGSTNASEEEKDYTDQLPHGSNSPANADTVSGGPADAETDVDDGTNDNAEGDDDERS